VTACRCKQPPAKPTSDDGVVRVLRETKGRKGKGVTIITGVPLAGDALKALAKTLKARCGSGGTIKDGVIEIQGDHRDALIPLLELHGWTVKRAGG
jgi:translation initiation factor 1